MSESPERPTGAAGADEPWTVGRVLAWATADFARLGRSSPRLDAELLLTHAIGLDRVRLIIERDRPLSAVELQRYRELIVRRRRAEPVAYILGVREFRGLPFRVDPRVLVPRPDTEILVEVALERTGARSLDGAALDLCTGSGCVALSLAHARPTWRGVASDIDEGALAVARDNALRLGLSHAVAFHQGDLFDALPGAARFELLTANPPYVTAAECETLEPDVRDFEPRLALSGGADGLDVIRRIVAKAPHWLSRDGLLALEIGADQAAATCSLFEQRGYRDVQVARDYGGRDRVVSGRRPPAPPSSSAARS